MEQISTFKIKKSTISKNIFEKNMKNSFNIFNLTSKKKIPLLKNFSSPGAAEEQSVRGIGDTPGAIVANAFDKFRFGEDLSPAVYLERIAAVTREDVMAVAAAYRLDTVYLLEEEK